MQNPPLVSSSFRPMNARSTNRVIFILVRMRLAHLQCHHHSGRVCAAHFGVIFILTPVGAAHLQCYLHAGQCVPFSPSVSLSFWPVRTQLTLCVIFILTNVWAAHLQCHSHSTPCVRCSYSMYSLHAGPCVRCSNPISPRVGCSPSVSSSFWSTYGLLLTFSVIFILARVGAAHL